MKLRFGFVCVALAAMAACTPAPQKAADGAAPSAPAASPPAASTVSVQPGWYETKIKVLSIENPNIPKSAMDMMKKSGNMDFSVSACVTQAEAADWYGRPQTRGADDTLDCGAQRYTIAGGRVSGTITCKGPIGEMTITTDGTYTPTSMSARTVMEGATPAGPMKQTMEMTSTRQRDCTPQEQASAEKMLQDAKAAMAK